MERARDRERSGGSLSDRVAKFEAARNRTGASQSRRLQRDGRAVPGGLQQKTEFRTSRALIYLSDGNKVIFLN